MSEPSVAVAGERYTVLSEMALEQVRTGKTAEEVYEFLAETNQELEEPLTDVELRTIQENTLRRHLQSRFDPPMGRGSFVTPVENVEVEAPAAKTKTTKPKAE